MLVRGFIKDAAGIPYMILEKHYDDSIRHEEAIEFMLEAIKETLEEGDYYNIEIIDTD